LFSLGASPAKISSSTLWQQIVAEKASGADSFTLFIPAFYVEILHCQNVKSNCVPDLDL